MSLILIGLRWLLICETIRVSRPPNTRRESEGLVISELGVTTAVGDAGGLTANTRLLRGIAIPRNRSIQISKPFISWNLRKKKASHQRTDLP